MMVAVGERVAFAVPGGGSAQFLQRVDAVQFKRAVVGPGDGAVGFEHDDAFIQTRDDALQVLAMRLGCGGVFGHVGLFGSHA
ncbi:hypothetical protein G6F40_017983 [Rhizopus arrhizus]|nr:hypothetical protein G6F40_017983 [Rhizopus arrhizus]